MKKLKHFTKPPELLSSRGGIKNRHKLKGKKGDPTLDKKESLQKGRQNSQPYLMKIYHQ